MKKTAFVTSRSSKKLQVFEIQNSKNTLPIPVCKFFMSSVWQNIALLDVQKLDSNNFSKIFSTFESLFGQSGAEVTTENQHLADGL